MKILYAAFASITLLPPAALALDLTPIHSFRNLEGVRIPIVQFADVNRRVTYQPPLHWRVSGSGQSIRLAPTDCDQAASQFRISPRPSYGGKDDAAALESWARAFLPPLATEIAKHGESVGEFTIGMAASREVSFSYTFAGRRYLSSVAVVELNEKEGLVVIVSALKPDFAAVHAETVASLFSWQWID